MKSFVFLMALFSFIHGTYAQDRIDNLAYKIFNLAKQHTQDLPRSDERKVQLHLEEVERIFQDNGFSLALGESSVSPCYFIVNNNNVLKKIHNEAGTTIERRENEKILFFLERAVKTGVCRFDTSETDCRQKEIVSDYYSQYCSPHRDRDIGFYINGFSILFVQGHTVCNWGDGPKTFGKRNYREKAQSAFERLKALCPQIRKD